MASVAVFRDMRCHQGVSMGNNYSCPVFRIHITLTHCYPTVLFEVMFLLLRLENAISQTSIRCEGFPRTHTSALNPENMVFIRQFMVQPTSQFQQLHPGINFGISHHLAVSIHQTQAVSVLTAVRATFRKKNVEIGG
jgi:hypothetical protein